MTLLRAIALASAALVAFLVHEIAAATVASALGDRSAVRWGRRSLDPRRHLDPFGSVLLPLIGVGLAATGSAFPVFAYGTPHPSDPRALRDARRGPILVALAGPTAQLVLAALAGVVVRSALLAGSRPVAEIGAAVLWVSTTMAVLHLVPIPGLDGSRILVRFLPARAAEVYRGLDAYLPLFLLVILFVIPGPLLGIVGRLTALVCGALAGAPVC
ncbi:MAG: site-2 protease family protein [Actinomycetota bacterium]